MRVTVWALSTLLFSQNNEAEENTLTFSLWSASLQTDAFRHRGCGETSDLGSTLSTPKNKHINNTWGAKRKSSHPASEAYTEQKAATVQYLGGWEG